MRAESIGKCDDDSGGNQPPQNSCQHFSDYISIRADGGDDIFFNALVIHPFRMDRRYAVEADVHGVQGQNTRNQEINIGSAVGRLNAAAQSPAKGYQIQEWRYHAG